MVGARLRRRAPGVVVGAALLLAMIALAIAAPLVAGDPIRPDVEHGLDADGAPLAPSSARLLGTDALGRDVWARLAFGARRSLVIAGAATALAVAMGAAVGVVAGLRGGATDAIAMRLVDAALALPAILVAAFVAVALRASGVDADLAAVLTLASLGWGAIARVVRARVRTVAASDFVLAARAIGAGPLRIATRHVAPMIAGLLAATATLALAHNFALEAALGYLGLGAPPPAPSWGRMIADGQPYLRHAPWLVAAPALAIVATVVACGLIADGLRPEEAPHA